MNLGAIKVALAALGIKTGSAAWPTAAQINALGLPSTWNASTNTPTLTSGVAPTTNNAFVATTTGTVNLGNGIASQAIGDVFYFDGTVWQVILNSASIGTTGSIVLKGNNTGGVTNATPGVDFGSPVAIQCAVPIVLPPNGTIGANGALTLGTALSAPTTSGWYDTGAWLYFPANAINSGSAAGFYWTVFTSTTAGTVYNNTYTPGTNSGAGSFTPPGSTTAFSGTTGAAYTTGTGAYVTALSYVLPANTLGKNGSIETRALVRNNNSAGAKTVRCAFGTTTIGFTSAVTTTISNALKSTIYNRGRTDRQVSMPNDIQTSGGSTNGTIVDTTANQTMNVQFQLATATDWVVYEAIALVPTGAP